MIKFQLLKKNLAALQCFTGLNLAAFYELLPSFERAYAADLDKRDKERSRKRLRAWRRAKWGTAKHGR